MSYTLNLTFNFGAGNTGLTLNGKLFDSAGAQVGSTVTSGFVELGSGGVYSYLATLPDGQVGTFLAYKSTDATIAVAVAVNPQEGEYTDAKTSGRMATYTQPTGFLAATFPGTVASPTNITAAAGCAVSSIGAGVITATSIAADAITAAKIATDAIDADALATDAVTEIQSGLSTLTAAGVRSAVGLGSANLDTQLYGTNPIRTGAAQTGSGASVVLDAGASSVNNFYRGCLVLITGGTGTGQVRTILTYSGLSKQAGVDRDWATIPDGTSTFAVLPDNAAALDPLLQPTAAGVTGDVNGDLFGDFHGTVLTKVTPVDVDGLTYASGTEAVYATLFGVTVVDATTAAFKKRDGTTTKVLQTYGDADGERTGSSLS